MELEDTNRESRISSANKVKASLITALIAGAALMPLVITPAAAGQTFSVLYEFGGKPDGQYPFGGLIADSEGNLYGSTQWGGSYDAGTVYQLLATGGETVLYSFAGGADGGYPQGRLYRDAAGNLYGTAFQGGSFIGNCFYGCGLVYEVSPQGEETVLYTFSGGADGSNPTAGLIGDAEGNLYGTTLHGGNLAGACQGFGCGVVFRLAPSGVETVLHKFSGAPDGSSPLAPVARDKSGNFYGTTSGGGVTGGACGRVGCGVVYKIDATGKESVLHSFVGNDGSSPQSGALTMDASGNLYGTVLGGTFSPYCMNTGCGVVFELDPAGKATVLHAFSGADGDSPGAGVVRDAMGNLYGTTQYGGANREGVAFKLSPTGNETILYTFDYPYGTTPHADLLPYRGYLYGTTFGGGTGAGTAFKLQP